MVLPGTQSISSLGNPDYPLHVSGVVVGRAGVAAAQNAGGSNGSAQLLGEAGASALGSDSSVLVLSEEDVGGARVAVVPLLPACRVDDAGHGGLLEDDLGVLAPGTAEVVGAIGDGVSGGGGDVAAVEDVLGLVGRAGTAIGYYLC